MLVIFLLLILPTFVHLINLLFRLFLSFIQPLIHLKITQNLYYLIGFKFVFTKLLPMINYLLKRTHNLYLVQINPNRFLNFLTDSLYLIRYLTNCFNHFIIILFIDCHFLIFHGK